MATVGLAGLAMPEPAKAADPCIWIEVPKKYNKGFIGTKVRAWRRMERRNATQIPIFVMFNGEPYLQNVGMNRKCDHKAAIAYVELLDPEKKPGGILAVADYNYGNNIWSKQKFLDPGYTFSFRLRDGDASCPVSPEYFAFLNAMALYFGVSANKREYRFALEDIERYRTRGECTEFQASAAYEHTRKLLKNQRRLAGF